MNYLKSVFLNLKEFLDQIPLPGFEGISILNLFQFLKKFSKRKLPLRSAAFLFVFL